MALAAAARVSPSHFWLHPPSVALKGPPALRDGPAAGGSRFPPPRGRARHPPAAPPPASSSLALALEISLSLSTDGALGTAELRDGKQRGGQQRTSRRFAPSPPSAHRERPPSPRVYIRHRRVRGARPYAKGRRATLFIFEPKNNRAEINTRRGGGGGAARAGVRGTKPGGSRAPPEPARCCLPERGARELLCPLCLRLGAGGEERGPSPPAPQARCPPAASASGQRRRERSPARSRDAGWCPATSAPLPLRVPFRERDGPAAKKAPLAAPGGTEGAPLYFVREVKSAEGDTLTTACVAK